MGIAFDGNVSLQASGLTLFAGRPGAIACWVRNPAVGLDGTILKVHNSSTGANLSIAGFANTAIYGLYGPAVGYGGSIAGGGLSGTWQPVMVRGSGASAVSKVEAWAGAATTPASAAIGGYSSTDAFATLTEILVGLGDSSEVAEIIVLGGAGLDDAAAQAFWNSFKAGALPETIAPGLTITHATLKDTTAPSLALSGGGTLATVGAGSITTSGTHPITRVAAPTLSGNVALDAVAPAGTLADAGPTALTGNVTLDAAVTAGTLGLQPGVLTTAPFRAPVTGSLLTGVTVPKVAVLRVSDMSNVLTLTDQVTNGSGVLSITNAAILQGVQYLLIACNADGTAFGAEAYIAT